MSRPDLVPIDVIVAGLTGRIDQLAREIIPGGRRDGAEWRAGSIQGEPGQSFAVRLTGAKAGTWADFAASPAAGMRGQYFGGDALDLVAWGLFGGNKTEAIRWAKAWLGLERTDKPFTTRAPSAPARRAEVERDQEGKRQKARALWHGAQPIAGTPAAAYLAGRGIDLAALPRVPGALRFSPKVWCQEASAELPGMLAAITCHGELVACHRTYLAEERGAWRKAPLRNAKKVLGSYAGGFIPLARGPSGKPIAEAPHDDQVAIAEGIEDGLTIALHEPALRVLAGISLSNLGAIVLPPQLTDILLIQDRDGENPQARSARIRAETWFLNTGASVRTVRPPEGFKDFNAWHQALQRKGNAA
jgi:hypothetical protein